MERVLDRELPCVQCGRTGIVANFGTDPMRELVLMRMVRDEHGRVGEWGSLFSTTLPSSPVHWASCLDPLHNSSEVVVAGSLEELAHTGMAFGWQFGAVRRYVMGWAVERHLPEAFKQITMLYERMVSTHHLRLFGND